MKYCLPEQRKTLYTLRAVRAFLLLSPRPSSPLSIINMAGRSDMIATNDNTASHWLFLFSNEKGGRTQLGALFRIAAHHCAESSNYWNFNLRCPWHFWSTINETCVAYPEATHSSTGGREWKKDKIQTDSELLSLYDIKHNNHTRKCNAWWNVSSEMGLQSLRTGIGSVYSSVGLVVYPLCISQT